MKLRKVLLAGVAGVALLGSAAYAEVDTQALAKQLQDQGFSRVEIKVGLTQVKVEAIRNGTKYEVVYDAQTGEIIKQETEAVRAGDDTTPGVEIDRRRRDFVDSDGSISDDDDDDDDDFDDDDSDDDDDDDDDDDRRSGRDDDDDDDDDDRNSGRDDDNDDDEEDDDDDDDSDDDDDDGDDD